MAQASRCVYTASPRGRRLGSSCRAPSWCHDHCVGGPSKQTLGQLETDCLTSTGVVILTAWLLRASSMWMPSGGHLHGWNIFTLWARSERTIPISVFQTSFSSAIQFCFLQVPDQPAHLHLWIRVGAASQVLPTSRIYFCPERGCSERAAHCWLVLASPVDPLSARPFFFSELSVGGAPRIHMCGWGRGHDEADQAMPSWASCLCCFLGSIFVTN